MPRDDAPPRSAVWLLARCLPEEDLESVLGDLEEEWRLLPRGGRSRLWYWRQALSLGGRSLALRLRERPRQKAKKGERMGQLAQDLRHGARVLLRKPGFAITAIVTLALGIGANAAIFSVVYGVLLHPLPYREPERVVTLWETDARQPGERLFVSAASFFAWRERASGALESLGAVSPWAVDYTGGDEPESIDAVLVSEGYFRTLGVEALLGRTFRSEEHQSGGAKVVVLSHALWQTKFGGDRGLVGRTLAFGQASYQVVGVLPPDFRSPVYAGRGIYAPLIFWPQAEQSRAQYLGVVGSSCGRRKLGCP